MRSLVRLKCSCRLASCRYPGNSPCDLVKLGDGGGRGRKSGSCDHWPLGVGCFTRRTSVALRAPRSKSSVFCSAPQGPDSSARQNLVLRCQQMAIGDIAVGCPDFGLAPSPNPQLSSRWWLPLYSRGLCTPFSLRASLLRLLLFLVFVLPESPSRPRCPPPLICGGHRRRLHRANTTMSEAVSAAETAKEFFGGLFVEVFVGGMCVLRLRVRACCF